MSAWFDEGGRAVLLEIVRAAGYSGLADVVARFSVFPHPDHVAETKACGVWPVIRTRDMKRRGEVINLSGRLIGLCDNASPREVLLCALGLSQQPQDTQVNHIYPTSDDPDAYTSLANLCLTPTFLAKLTDTDPEIMQAMRFRAFDLYGWTPSGNAEPPKPRGYDALPWAKPVKGVPSYVEEMNKRLGLRNNRWSRMIRQTGWLFSTENGAR